MAAAADAAHSAGWASARAAYPPAGGSPEAPRVPQQPKGGALAARCARRSLRARALADAPGWVGLCAPLGAPIPAAADDHTRHYRQNWYFSGSFAAGGLAGGYVMRP